jgi:hypothetical protein
VAQAQLLSQTDSFELVSRLNKAGKLVPESYLLPLRGLKSVKAENCFGVRLANGLHLVGESSGSSYGVHGSTHDAKGKETDINVLIGFLYAEFPFMINDKAFPAGPYMLHAHKEALELVGNAETGTRYDMNRRKNVPLGKEEKLALKTALTDAVLAEKATEIPRASLTVDHGSIVLSLQDNNWRIVPR